MVALNVLILTEDRQRYRPAKPATFRIASLTIFSTPIGFTDCQNLLQPNQQDTENH
jgi:hypothetical protein